MHHCASSTRVAPARIPFFGLSPAVSCRIADRAADGAPSPASDGRTGRPSGRHGGRDEDHRNEDHRNGDPMVAVPDARGAGGGSKATAVGAAPAGVPPGRPVHRASSSTGDSRPPAGAVSRRIGSGRRAGPAPAPLSSTPPGRPGEPGGDPLPRRDAGPGIADGAGPHRRHGGDPFDVRPVRGAVRATEPPSACAARPHGAPNTITISGGPARWRRPSGAAPRAHGRRRITGPARRPRVRRPRHRRPGERRRPGRPSPGRGTATAPRRRARRSATRAPSARSGSRSRLPSARGRGRSSPCRGIPRLTEHALQR